MDTLTIHHTTRDGYSVFIDSEGICQTTRRICSEYTCSCVYSNKWAAYTKDMSAYSLRCVRLRCIPAFRPASPLRKLQALQALGLGPREGLPHLHPLAQRLVIR